MVISKNIHDDVIKWKHFQRYWPIVRGIHRSPVNSPHKGQWRGGLMFSLICAWTNGWVNSLDAGNFRRHCAHYDVVVSETKFWSNVSQARHHFKKWPTTSLEILRHLENLDSSQCPCTALTADICMPLMLCKGTISGLDKRRKFPPVTRAHNALKLRYFPTYIQTNQSQTVDSRQLDVKSHTSLTDLLPPGWDCVAVYWRVDKPAQCTPLIDSDWQRGFCNYINGLLLYPRNSSIGLVPIL